MASNPRKINMAGQQFGLWHVLKQSGNRKGGAALWLCKCACGSERTVAGSDLRSAKSVSCGCAKRRTEPLPAKKHVDWHGGVGTRLYRIWNNMKTRCADTTDKRYGGKGIKICEAWLSFSSFRDWAESHGYSADLSIERLDSNGDYSPENCVWADAKTQARNRSIVLRAPDGTPWAAIAEAHGVPVGIMHNRMSSGGWPVEIAATWPVGKPRSNITRERNEKGQWTPVGRNWRRKQPTN